MKNLFGIVFITLFFSTSSCRRDDDNTPLPQVTLSCTNITTNTTLDVANYLVDCVVDVRNNAVLTIQPGTKFTFTANGGFSTSAGGAIKASGTADKKIAFTGKEAIKGFWKGININTNSLNNQFNHCMFEYGGKGQTMVRLGGDNSLTSKAVFTNCKFINSGTNGLFVNEQSTIAGSGLNEFNGNVEYPIWFAYENVSDLDNTNTFTGNGKNKIYIESDDYNINKVVVFNKVSVPYLLAHTSGSPLKRIYKGFTISAGTVIEISPNLLFEIQPAGYFKAQGTASENIIIRGQEATKGYWDKIRFAGSPSSENIFEHCQISDGGNFYDSNWNDKGMITIKDIYDATSRISINNCRFSNSLNYGIDLWRCAASGATVVNGAKGASAIKSALETANEFPASTASDKNDAGNVRTTN